jgi:hypothetical protein
VTDQKPMWTAARLNEFISRFGGAPVGLTPPGGIFRHESLAWSSAFEMDVGVVRPADTAHITKDRTRSLVDVLCLDVIGIETATQNLARLPIHLSICAFDPEAWCAVVLHPGAIEVVGPFRDVVSPLGEWLLRAVNAGHAIGTSHGSEPERLLEATHDAGMGVISPAPAVGFLSKACVLAESMLPELVPAGISEKPAWLAEYLELFAARQFGCAVNSEPDRIALAAGIWQMNGFLNRSHELAQSIEGKGGNRTGDYWHAIMHRREPDYSNAKYWFRRVGQHGIHPFLARDAGDILAACCSADAPRWRSALTGRGGQKWDALAFVDLCEKVAAGRDDELSLGARKIQLIEMVLLLSSTYHDAVE